LHLEVARLLAAFLGDVVGDFRRVVWHGRGFDPAGLTLSVRRRRASEEFEWLLESAGSGDAAFASYGADGIPDDSEDDRSIFEEEFGTEAMDVSVQFPCRT